MRLIELFLIQIPSVIWSPIAGLWKLNLSCRRDFGFVCLCYGIPEQHHSSGWLLEIGISPRQKFSYQFLWEIPVPFQSEHSVWNNLGFLHMIFPRMWILRNLRGLRSLLVKTGLGIIHKQWRWWKCQCHQPPEESCCYPPELACISSERGIFKAGHGTPSLSAVEAVCCISCRQRFVNPSASRVFCTTAW